MYLLIPWKMHREFEVVFQWGIGECEVEEEENGGIRDGVEWKK